MSALESDDGDAAACAGGPGRQLQTGVQQVVVAMITSRMFRAGHPSRVAILRASSVFRQSSGLLTDSVVLTDNLATIFLTAVDRVVGPLPMTDVEKALRHTFGI